MTEFNKLSNPQNSPEAGKWRVEGDLFDEAERTPKIEINRSLAGTAVRGFQGERILPPVQDTTDLAERQKSLGIEVDEGSVDIRQRAQDQRLLKPKRVDDDEDFSNNTYLRPL